MVDDTSETELTHQHPLFLEVTVPDHVPYRVALAGKSALVIGRSRNADLHVDHRSVSREHARLALGARLEITDLGSGNGTRVRGRDLEAHQTTSIGIGEVIELGSVVISVLAIRNADSRGRQPDAEDGWYAPVSPAMRGVLAALERVAPSESSVLLVGEAGVGKEVCARLIHQRSPRAARPFVRARASGISDHVLDKELFGGGSGEPPGALENAHGGAILLDDIDALPPALQLKLLHVIDRRELPRAGTRDAVPIDVRFVMATRRSLGADVTAGRFREDLYYRIAGVTIEIPPLRARIEDIVPLASYLLTQAARRRKREDLRLTSEVAALLVRHAWPGNIRELRDAIVRAVVVCGDGPLRPEHVVLAPHAAAPGEIADTGPLPRLGGLTDEVEDLERRRVDATLAAAGGNQSEAARRLGISRGALLARLRAWGMTPRRR